MLIKSLFGEQHETLKELTADQLQQKKMNSPELQFHRNRKKVVFIVPTNNLVDQ